MICSCALILGGCALVRRPPASPSTQPIIADQTTNEGYSLLYDLMDEESKVSGIFIIKRVDDSVGNPVREIAGACAAARRQLDQFRSQNPTLRYEVPNLPAVESRSRALQSSDERRRLLTSSGKEFELRLVFTQAEAMNYADTLCRALAEREKNLQRKEFLQRLAMQCGGCHERLMKLMSVRETMKYER